MTSQPEARLNGTPSYSVPPVVRAVKVLRHIAAGRSVANQSRAAREIGINRTTLLRLLHTLEAEGLIERSTGSDDYVLGTGVIELAAQKIFSLDVAQVASPILTRLAATLGLSCHLAILDGREVLYLLRSTPNVHLVSNVRIGTRMPAHASSMGLAILAHTPTAEVDALFGDSALFPVTAKTPTSKAALRQRLAETEAAGFADSRSHYEIGIDSIAAPVLDYAGQVVAAINASGPDSAFDSPRHRRAEIARSVREAAMEISKRLGFVPKTVDPAVRRKQGVRS